MFLISSRLFRDIVPVFSGLFLRNKSPQSAFKLFGLPEAADRTVRIALWDAEEEGLIGSREYVKTHFADRDTMALKPEHAIALSATANFVGALVFGTAVAGTIGSGEAMRPKIAATSFGRTGFAR